MPSPFENDTAAREVLEKLRWPDEPSCPRSDCGGHGADVFRIGGEKHSHRDGLYLCKMCRRQFSVTVGTPLERRRIPLSTWVLAARAFSYQAPKGTRGRDRYKKPTLLDIQFELNVAYRTVLRMRDVIRQAAGKYRGHKYVFGAWPRSFMQHQRENHEKTIKASGVLAGALPPSTYTQGEVNRTERLLRLLLATPKPPRKRRASSGREERGRSLSH
jgi:transposase-like protein